MKRVLLPPVPLADAPTSPAASRHTSHSGVSGASSPTGAGGAGGAAVGSAAAPHAGHSSGLAALADQQFFADDLPPQRSPPGSRGGGDGHGASSAATPHSRASNTTNTRARVERAPLDESDQIAIDDDDGGGNVGNGDDDDNEHKASDAEDFPVNHHNDVDPAGAADAPADSSPPPPQHHILRANEHAAAAAAALHPQRDDNDLGGADDAEHQFTVHDAGDHPDSAGAERDFAPVSVAARVLTPNESRPGISVPRTPVPADDRQLIGYDDQGRPIYDRPPSSQARSRMDSNSQHSYPQGSPRSLHAGGAGAGTSGPAAGAAAPIPMRASISQLRQAPMRSPSTAIQRNASFSRPASGGGPLVVSPRHPDALASSSSRPASGARGSTGAALPLGATPRRNGSASASVSRRIAPERTGSMQASSPQFLSAQEAAEIDAEADGNVGANGEGAHDEIPGELGDDHRAVAAHPNSVPDSASSADNNTGRKAPRAASTTARASSASVSRNDAVPSHAFSRSSAAQPTRDAKDGKANETKANAACTPASKAKRGDNDTVIAASAASTDSNEKGADAASADGKRSLHEDVSDLKERNQRLEEKTRLIRHLFFCMAILFILALFGVAVGILYFFKVVPQKADTTVLSSGLGGVNTGTFVLANNSIYEYHLTANSVTAREIAPGAVTTPAIAAGAVGMVQLDSTLTAAIADARRNTTLVVLNSSISSVGHGLSLFGGTVLGVDVDNSSIGLDAFDRVTVKPASLTGAQIADASVPGTKIQNGSLGDAAFARSSISGSVLQDRSIERGKFASSVAGSGLVVQSDGSLGVSVQSGGALAFNASTNALIVRSSSIDGTLLGVGSVATQHLIDQAVSFNKLDANVQLLLTSLNSGGTGSSTDLTGTTARLGRANASFVLTRPAFTTASPGASTKAYDTTFRAQDSLLNASIAAGDLILQPGWSANSATGHGNVLLQAYTTASAPTTLLGVYGADRSVRAAADSITLSSPSSGSSSSSSSSSSVSITPDSVSIAASTIALDGRLRLRAVNVQITPSSSSEYVIDMHALTSSTLRFIGTNGGATLVVRVINCDATSAGISVTLINNMTLAADLLVLNKSTCSDTYAVTVAPSTFTTILCNADASASSSSSAVLCSTATGNGGSSNTAGGYTGAVGAASFCVGPSATQPTIAVNSPIGVLTFNPSCDFAGGSSVQFRFQNSAITAQHVGILFQVMQFGSNDPSSSSSAPLLVVGNISLQVGAATVSLFNLGGTASSLANGGSAIRLAYQIV